MKSIESFDNFYNSDLKSKIDKLEAERLAIAEKFSFQRYKRNLKWLAFLFVIIAIASAAVPHLLSDWVGIIIPVIIVYGIAGGIYIYFKRNKHFRPIKLEYKQTIIPKIIDFVQPGLTYKPNEGITKGEFSAGNLFGSYTTFKSEDLVYGKTDIMEIKMSDIECTRRKSNSGKSGGSSTVTIFKGFYVISKMNGSIPSGVTIKTSLGLAEALKGVAGKFLGGFIEMIDRKLNLNAVKTGDEEFDKMYVVKSVNPEVAKTLLTPRFIQVIMSFRKEIDLPVSFSFFDNYVHIAFSGINLFEAEVSTSFVEKNISRQYFNYLNLAFGITEAIQITR